MYFIAAKLKHGHFQHKRIKNETAKRYLQGCLSKDYQIETGADIED